MAKRIQPRKSFAKFVRTHLMSNERATIRDLYKEYKAVCEGDSPPRTPARYSSCRIIISVLRRCGVVKDVKVKKAETEPMYKWTMHDKKFVAIVPGMDTHPVWDDPWKYLKSKREIKQLSQDEGVEATLIGESDIVEK